jgi:hypothetical protein
MVQVQQRVLSAAALVLVLAPAIAEARRFYRDDPIEKVPPPMPVDKANPRELSEYYDFFYNTFGKPGEHFVDGHIIRAQAVNTLGEVPDSEWYTNRHYKRRMTIDELMRGPGTNNDPSGAWPWKVTGAKTQGVTPGLRIADSRGRRYLIKFDPIVAPELASAADVIGTKFFYALGYNVPENYVVYFRREDLVVDPKAKLTDKKGRERPMADKDIDDVLVRVPREKDGRYRALASFYLAGQPLEGFRYNGTRSDDPNDIVPHEHRRDLRGLYVFSSWLNHTDTKSINTLDTLVSEQGRKYIRHHLIDFGAILGSDSFEPKSPRAGNVYLFDWTSSAQEFFTLGLYIPRWTFANFPHIRGVGHFESAVFNPDEWKNNYYNPAFANCLPDDGFWAAKQVMNFSEPEIRAMVSTGKFTDERAVEYLTKTLIERQQKIGRAWFSKVLALDNFRVEGNRLAFDDLGLKYRFEAERNYSISWFRFNNDDDSRVPIPGAMDRQIPPADYPYIGAEILSGDPHRNVLVYLRKQGSTWLPVGIDRNW